mmetsp:Transcript_35355/g.85562  ORF Transcript_35355/g.85562 Transcript_35355/m.85562 type:complete len:1313 (+) Transcript_35355:170-4108(+)
MFFVPYLVSTYVVLPILWTSGLYLNNKYYYDVCPVIKCFPTILECLQRPNCKSWLEDDIGPCSDPTSIQRRTSAEKFRHVQHPDDAAYCQYQSFDAIQDNKALEFVECIGQSGCIKPATQSDECADMSILKENNKILSLLPQKEDDNEESSTGPNPLVLDGTWYKLYTTGWDMWECQWTDFWSPQREEEEEEDDCQTRCSDLRERLFYLNDDHRNTIEFFLKMYQDGHRLDDSSDREYVRRTIGMILDDVDYLEELEDEESEFDEYRRNLRCFTRRELDETVYSIVDALPYVVLCSAKKEFMFWIEHIIRKQWRIKWDADYSDHGWDYTYIPDAYVRQILWDAIGRAMKRRDDNERRVQQERLQRQRQRANNAQREMMSQLFGQWVNDDDNGDDGDGIFGDSPRTASDRIVQELQSEVEAINERMSSIPRPPLGQQRQEESAADETRTASGLLQDIGVDLAAINERISSIAIANSELQQQTDRLARQVAVRNNNTNIVEDLAAINERQSSITVTVSELQQRNDQLARHVGVRNNNTSNIEDDDDAGSHRTLSDVDDHEQYTEHTTSSIPSDVPELEINDDASDNDGTISEIDDHDIPADAAARVLADAVAQSVADAVTEVVAEAQARAQARAVRTNDDDGTISEIEDDDRNAGDDHDDGDGTISEVEDEHDSDPEVMSYHPSDDDDDDDYDDDTEPEVMSYHPSDNDEDDDDEIDDEDVGMFRQMAMSAMFDAMSSQLGNPAVLRDANNPRTDRGPSGNSGGVFLGGGGQGIRFAGPFPMPDDSDDEDENSQDQQRRKRDPTTVVCPVCSEVYCDYQEWHDHDDDVRLPASTAGKKLQYTDLRLQHPNHHRAARKNPSHGCSHGATLMFGVKIDCPICMEEDVPAPNVVLSCGHVVCKEDFINLGGFVGQRPSAETTSIAADDETKPRPKAKLLPLLTDKQKSDKRAQTAFEEQETIDRGRRQESRRREQMEHMSEMGLPSEILDFMTQVISTSRGGETRGRVIQWSPSSPMRPSPLAMMNMDIGFGGSSGRRNSRNITANVRRQATGENGFISSNTNRIDSRNSDDSTNSSMPELIERPGHMTSSDESSDDEDSIPPLLPRSALEDSSSATDESTAGLAGSGRRSDSGNNVSSSLIPSNAPSDARSTDDSHRNLGDTSGDGRTTSSTQPGSGRTFGGTSNLFEVPSSGTVGFSVELGTTAAAAAAARSGTAPINGTSSSRIFSIPSTMNGSQESNVRIGINVVDAGDFDGLPAPLQTVVSRILESAGQPGVPGGDGTNTTTASNHNSNNTENENENDEDDSTDSEMPPLVD